MDQKKQNGFSLFPTPPTPPAKRSRARTGSSSGGSSKLIKSRTSTIRGHGRKLSTSVVDQTTQPGLIPAPLKIRKPSEDIPPIPALIAAIPPSTPVKPKEFVLPPKTPESAPPQLPALPPSSPFSTLPRTPPRRGSPRSRARLVAEFIELDAASKKRASSRLSQWLDLEDGEIDRRRLSKYLGSVLDNTFEVPTFEPGSRASIALQRRLSKYELDSLAEGCECPPNTIICACSSSPEFERFRSWSSHKANLSISSTACMLGVPRARFHSAFFNVEPTIAEVSSPPGLSYDTEDNPSESGDWTTPLTPSKDDVFGSSSSRGRSYSSKYVIPSLPSTPSSQSRIQSFSRPFRPDSTYRCMISDDSAPTTPSRSDTRSTDMKLGFLTSISTMSSFDFDFDAKSRRQSLARLKLQEMNLSRQESGDKDSSNHLRTDSNESFVSQASQYEVNTATASVALSGSIIKPVLITKAMKQVKMPSNVTRSQGSTSTTTSSQTSASSFTVPDYWRQYDAGVRARSRSTTVGSSATTASAAFSALLTMPMLSPKMSQLPAAPVSGNAFAQRSNTTATMPATLSSKEASAFDFGTATPAADTVLGRSNTTPALAVHIDRSPAKQSSSPLLKPPTSPLPKQPTSPSFQHSISPFLQHPVSPPLKQPTSPLPAPPTSPLPNVQINTPLPTEQISEPVQAYANVHARLRAFMSSIQETPPIKTEKTGLGITNESTPRQKKDYLCVDERVLNRDDSGVFGRISGVSLGVGQHRTEYRQFSEPQYYRYANVN